MRETVFFLFFVCCLLGTCRYVRPWYDLRSGSTGAALYCGCCLSGHACVSCFFFSFFYFYVLVLAQSSRRIAGRNGPIPVSHGRPHLRIGHPQRTEASRPRRSARRVGRKGSIGHSSPRSERRRMS